MSLILDLPDELEQALAQEAAQLGFSVEEYAVQLLTLRRATAGLPQTGADLVAYWQREGVIGSRADIEDSAAYARKLRARAEHRHRG